MNLKRRLGFGALALALAACGDDGSVAAVAPPRPDPSCQGIYGSPSENTGLSSDVCVARVEGTETWTPRSWDAASLAALRAWTLEDPPSVPTEDPFETNPDLQPDEDAVCAFMRTGQRSYRLKTFESVSAAESAGGIVTHGVGCGVCSSLEDLAAYVEFPDQTGPVRQCALDNIGRPIDELDACIQAAVGLSPPCARMYAYQSVNDTRECLDECIDALGSPYHEADGSLNPCLQCDEDKSGPVFQTVAGRTRRSSGLPAAICRPCEVIWRVDHIYPDAELPRFDTSRPDANTLVMVYTSGRPFATLAQGLINGCIAHYEEPMSLHMEDLSDGASTHVRFTLTKH